MLLKIILAGVILIIGEIIFSSEIQEFFPNTTTNGVNSLKSDIQTLTTHSIESAEEKIDSSIEKTHSTLVEIKDDSSEFIEEKITDKIFLQNFTE